MRYPTRFSDGGAAAAYFDRVVTTRWFANRWPAVIRRRITVKESNHANAWADQTNNVIFLPPWSLTDYTLLHEVAHFCSARQRSQIHGTLFRECHHALIERFMGVEVAQCYRHSCLAYGLGW